MHAHKLTDQYNRVASYLRIGVTDRCNLRCRYCMPEEGIDFSSQTELLTDEEIIRLSRIFVRLGVTKIRLTGGEPFSRKGIDHVLRYLAKLDIDIHITTNATLLHRHIDLLKDINVKGLNISIDSLMPERFQLITRRDSFELVRNNILRCIEERLPTKLNVVVMKGVNDMELLDFIAFGRQHGVEVRFIEAMPFNEDDGNKGVFLSASHIEKIIRVEHPSLEKLRSPDPSACDVYTIDDYQLGIIPSYSRTLCASCNRIRLTPQGELLTCLYAQSGHSLRDYMREGATDDALIQLITDAVRLKKKSGHDEEKERGQQVFQSMTSIGG